MKILAKQRLVAKNYEAEFDKLYDIYVTPFMGNKTLIQRAVKLFER